MELFRLRICLISFNFQGTIHDRVPQKDGLMSILAIREDWRNYRSVDDIIITKGLGWEKKTTPNEHPAALATPVPSYFSYEVPFGNRVIGCILVAASQPLKKDPHSACDSDERRYRTKKVTICLFAGPIHERRPRCVSFAPAGARPHAWGH